jgi:type I restriction enzyme, S subunit
MNVKLSSIKTVRIKDVAELDPETLGESTSPEFTFKYIDLSSVKSGRISNQVEQMTFQTAPGRARKLVKHNDILLGMVRPYLKPFAKVQALEHGYVASTGFAVIRAKAGTADSEYLYQTIWSDGISKQIHQMVTGSNYPALSVGDVKDIKIPLPPLAEQRKIAEILGTWDEAIETAEAELEIKQERKRWLMDKLLVGDWEKKTINDLFELEGSGIDKIILPGEQVVPLVNYMDAYGKRFLQATDVTAMTSVSSSDLERCKLRRGDIVMTPSSETPDDIAHSALIDFEPGNAVHSYHLFRLRPRQDIKFVHEFGAFFLNHISIRRQFIRISNGTTRFTLTLPGVRSIEVSLPPEKHQRYAAELLQDAVAQEELATQRIQALRTQKRGLMQKLLTGEIRVAA